MRAEVLQVALDHWWRGEGDSNPPSIEYLRKGPGRDQLHELAIPRLTPHLSAEAIRSVPKSAVGEVLAQTVGGHHVFAMKFVADEDDKPDDVARLRRLVKLAEEVSRVG